MTNGTGILLPADQKELALLVVDMAKALRACVEALEEAGLYSRSTTQAGREVFARLDPLLRNRSGE